MHFKSVHLRPDLRFKSVCSAASGPLAQCENGLQVAVAHCLIREKV